jgi:hypothetical protein
MARDMGQSRVPEPPDRMTGWIGDAPAGISKFLRAGGNRAVLILAQETPLKGWD